MKPLIASVFLLSLVFASFAHGPSFCPQNPTRDLIQTGIINFVNSRQR